MGNIMLTSVLSMAGLAGLFATVLALADKKLRVEEDPMVGKVSEILPGVNCGACGCLSCHDFAEHIVKENADPSKCRVLDAENREILFEILGRDGGDVNPFIPLIHCSAKCENKKPVADYEGIKTCRAANLAFGGTMECQFGCMGFGDCVNICPFGALEMVDGLPEVDQEKCTGCGQCADTCPRNIIEMQEKKYESIFFVACNTSDGALRVRKICGVGCIGCKICEKLSPEGFFTVTNNLSKANFEKQQRLKHPDIRKIMEKCPTKVIKEI